MRNKTRNTSFKGNSSFLNPCYSLKKEIATKNKQEREHQSYTIMNKCSITLMESILQQMGRNIVRVGGLLGPPHWEGSC